MLAHVRLYAQMNKQMTLEVSLGEERLLTIGALVFTVVGVGHQMPVQGAFCGVRFATAWIRAIVHRLEVTLLV